MDLIKILELKETRLKDNDADAALLQQQLDCDGTFLVNVMSAPGSGKTTLLCALIPQLQPDLRVGVMEADIDGDVDAYRVREAGASAVQVHTGGMCHLDADMTRQSLAGLPEKCDLAFLENIGNLVCPAEYATGAHLNLALLSVPEGDDKPLKYPLLFGMCDAVIVTKSDTSSYFNFSVDHVREALNKANPDCALFITSAKAGEGIPAVAEWLKQRYAAWKEACACHA